MNLGNAGFCGDSAGGWIVLPAHQRDNGPEVTDDSQLPVDRELAVAKKDYDKIAPAMAQVEETGYGIVQPNLSEMNLEEPRSSARATLRVRLMAKAPSLHIIKTDITTEVAPVVGSLRQSEDLFSISSANSKATRKIWKPISSGNPFMRWLRNRWNPSWPTCPTIFAERSKGPCRRYPMREEST